MDKKAGGKNRRKIIRALRILMQGCFWGCVAAGSLFVIGGILLYIWPEAVAKVPGLFGLYGTVRIQINDAFIFSIGKLNSIYVLPQSILTMTAWEKLVFLYFAVPNFAMALFFYQLHWIMVSVEKGSAFAPENARRLVVMGFVPIGLFLLETIKTIVLIATYRGMSSIPQTYDLGGLFLGAILLILSRVFKHGQYLQEEYDATL